MIPIQLTIQGLFSYQASQTIDFRPLVASQVFGVFGKVGSGKSSILDAISFALYGELDRLYKQDNRNYNMMNLKSKELWIDFEFISGPDNCHYRYTVKGKRNSKNFKEVKKLDRKAYKKITDEWIPINENDTEKLIGISYKNFRRTVIIPQGRFQEFLQLGNKDRSTMLKEIFNLQKYDLLYNTATLQKANETKISELEGASQQYNDINPNILKDKKNNLKNIIKENKEIQNQIIKLKSLLTNLKTTKQILENKLNIKSTLDTLLKQKAEFELLSQTINDIEYCLIHFKPLFERDNYLTNKINALKINTSSLLQNIEENQNTRASKNLALAKYKTIVDQKINIYKSIEELNKIIEIKKLLSAIKFNQERINKGEDVIEKLETKHTANIKQLSSLKETLKTHKLQKLDLKTLSAIKIWYANKNNLQGLLLDINTNYNEEETALLTLKNMFFTEEKNRISYSKIDFTIDDSTNILVQLDKIKKENKIQIESLQEEKLKLSTHLKLVSLSKELHDGDSCPLCGSIDHPNKLTLGSTDKAIGKIEQQITVLTEQNEHNANLKTSFNQWIFKKNEKEQRLDVLAQKKIALQRKINTHLATFNWPDFKSDNEDQFNVKYLDAEKQESVIEELENKIEDHHQAIITLEKDLKRFKEGFQKILDKQNIDTSSKNNLLQQLKLLSLSKYENKSIIDIENEAQSLENNINQAEISFQKLTIELDTLQTSIENQKGKKTIVDKQKGSFEKELNDVQNGIKTSLQTSSIKDKLSISKLLNSSVHLEDKKQKLRSYETELGSVKKQFDLIEKQTKALTFDKDFYAEQLIYEETLNTRYTNKQEAVGSLKKEIESLEKNLIEKSKLKKSLDKLIIRRDHISTLKRMFVGNGFIDYISSVYLEQLCQAANSRFHNLTKQQLRLALTEKNDFKVIDYLNEGKERSVKTLSGGQMFQASLSLALALAENVQQQNKSNQNFFFLDEGFGTQDKSSLQIVFNTIKSLRKENRVVGIISHLEELQNEIDVYIKVENHNETGSFLRTSY